MTKRDGTARTTPDVPRVLVPVCGQGSPHDCNGWLNETFELPGRRVVRDVLDNEMPLDAADTEMFARWWMKTSLRVNHPNARDTFPGGDRSNDWNQPPRLLHELRRTGAFPRDLSLWLAVFDHNARSGQLPRQVRIVLSHALRSDAGGGEGHSVLDSVSLAGGRLALFQLVFHPSCDLEHPFEEAGLVTRLWPNPPSRLDVARGPSLNDVGKEQLGHVFVSGGSVAIAVPDGYRLELPAVPEGESLGQEVILRRSSPRAN